MANGENNKMQLSSIKKMQELMQSNALASLSASVRKLRAKLDQLSNSLNQKQLGAKKQEGAESVNKTEELASKPI